VASTSHASPNGGREDDVLWDDGERLYRRMWRDTGDGNRRECLVAQPCAEHPTPATISRLTHEYGLKDYLDHPWALRPRELVREHGQTMLVLESTNARPLDQIIGPGAPVDMFLGLAITVTNAVARLHQSGLVHKDLKASNILIDTTSGEVRLTGFGIATRLPRERQRLNPPELIEGTLSHMAPEQTGRMNRSIDSRSDLYSLGITLYHTLTGRLPFMATEPMEWVHCHIARNPTLPHTVRESIPSQLSAIVMKLLAKTPEERYQTAAAVERDLRRCLSEWETRGVVEEFQLGEADCSDRLLMPERLYGRDSQIRTLLAAFDEVVAGGSPRLVLVSGHAGIGKSSVVNELHKILVLPRGLFASGKFDQLKRDIPYATVAQAFQSLIRQLLAKPEAELNTWRDQLRQALDPNGALVTDLIPELKFIVGEQPAVPEVPPTAAKVRFQHTLLKFIGVFARAEHPLALFLDDLQWLDVATLDLLESMLVESELRHLLLVGAYRDNEVDGAHPLTRRLSAIRESGAIVRDIVLGPLDHDHLTQWLADALHSEPQRAGPLAKLVHDKTAGNPFFANQFLQELVAGDLITFDADRGNWRWDLGPIRAKGYTDNVVDLMVGKLSRLPRATQQALTGLACLGNSARASTLAAVRGTSEEQLHSDFWDALRLEVIVRSEDSYRFVHDRVQEAAYSLLSEEQRAPAHLRIGRLLARQVEPDQQDEAVFEIVGHFNRAVALLTSEEERDQVAALNLVAGKRAKKAAAVGPALSYLTAGSALMANDGWQRRHDLLFELELHRAECEFLDGDITSAEQRLTMLSSRAASVGERCAVACLVADVSWPLQQLDRGLVECLECLRSAGLEIPLHPTRVQAQAAYDRICSKFESVDTDELARLPLLTDPTSRAILDVIARVMPMTIVTDLNLGSLLICAAVDLSLEHGHCDSSCLAYEFLGFTACWHFDDFEAGVRFGRLGLELIARKGEVEPLLLRGFESFICNIFSATIMPWTTHIANCREVVRTGFEVANNSGNRHAAVASRCELISNLLWAGDPLAEAAAEAEIGLEFCRKAAFRDYIDQANMQAAFVRNLRGLTRQFGSLDEGRFNELRMQTHFESQPHVVTQEFRYWTTTLQARFLAGDFAAALDASIRAETMLSESRRRNLCFGTDAFRVESEFYGALAHAAACDSASGDERRHHVDTVVGHLQQLELWARHCPANFENRAALVAAELARIEGRDGDATRRYEHAIRSARENGFVHHEAVALELAARFYEARGFDRIAKAYVRDARYGYAQWGAEGKVRQLEAQYPYLTNEHTRAAAQPSVLTPVEHLDLSTVLHVSQAVQGEIDLERLIAVIMRLSVEHAGAERGLLILPRADAYWIEAEARSASDAVTVELRPMSVGADDLPPSVLQYVLRTRKRVLLQDAAAASEFVNDEYLRGHQSRSVLCIPLLKQTRLVGIIYLENNLTSAAFTPARMAVLEVLASDAAISLENARLYRDLQEREARVRRLIDANIIGVFTWHADGRVFDANDEFLRIIGYSREEFASSGVRWTDFTLRELRERDLRLLEELRGGGAHKTEERELLRKDGARVPVLAGGSMFGGTTDQGVSFVVDLTERKRAELALRESEREARLIVETIPGMVASLTPDGELEFVNKELVEYCGQELDDMKQWGTNGTVHADDLPHVVDLFARGITSGEPYDFDMRVRRFDGVYRWFQVRGFPLRDMGGQVVRWYSLLSDIDDRKRAEQALRKSEREFRLLVETIPALVWRGTAEGELDFLNERAVEYLGLTVESLTGERWLQLVHPDHRDATVRRWLLSITTGSSYDDVYRLRRADGEYRWIQSVGEPFRDTEGRITNWYGLVIDIEDRKRAETELRALKDQLYKENLVLRDEVDRTSMFEEIVGTSAALQPVLARMAKVARTDSTVLITGETGTGKELVARAIHRRSARASRAFVSVNCAAVPRELIASELFGHEKGAFTGATQRRLGRFELAHGGTIFLDEVGELPMETQVALLRVLQEREFERVGGSTSIRIDVRVVAATNRDLEAAIETGSFRSDLFYRLNVFPIAVPALRERADDIPLLVEYFIDRYARKAGKTIRRVNKRTLDHLRSYPWPGNVRELQNVIERSVIVCDTDEFTVDESWLSARPPVAGSVALSGSLAAQEKAMIEDALRASGGRVFGSSGAAARLGVPRSTLESKIRALKINKNRFRSRPPKN
jgi:PAS domain S-box-containing protein